MLPHHIEQEGRLVRILAGCVLIHAAEQAYAHMNLVQFPNYETAAHVLLPSSIILLVLGTLLVIWGCAAEVRIRRDISAKNCSSSSV